MKKLLTGLVLVTLVSIGHAFAQYNNTFSTYINGGYIATRTVDIAETGNGEICMLGTDNYQSNNLIVLRQLDNMGNLLFETAHTLPSTYPTQLLYTVNGEYIVVGYRLENIPGPSPASSYTKQPFAAKFDNAGALVWMEVYNENTLYVNNDLSRINVVYCADDPNTESYIVTFPADQGFYPPPSDAYGFLNQDVTIGALRFDGSNGSLMWARKYYQSSINRHPDVLTRGDYPHALAYGNNKYFISGRAASTVAWSLPNYSTFMMSIDNAGSIVDWYRNVNITNVDMYHDAIYDANTNEYVMSFTACLPGGVSSTTATAFHVMKVDADNSNSLGINAIHFYYDATSSVENYAFGIKETPNNDAYVVGGMISGGNYLGQQMADASAMLRVLKNATPDNMKRYNVFKSHWPSGVASYFNPNAGMENNAVGTTPISASNKDMRVIATDNALDVPCAALDRTIGYDMPLYTVDPQLQLDDAPSTQSTSVFPNNPGISSSFTMCTGALYHNYKTNSVTDINKETTLKVYPTILTGMDNTLHFDITAASSTEFTITAASVDGRILGTHTANVAQGENKLTWTLPVATPGNYLIYITSADNAISKTERISKR